MSKFAMYDGHVIDMLNIKPSDITLDRIAHHLASIQRFGGSLPLHTTYSVAEHCINLSTNFSTDEEVRHALMHDATEAFLGDIVSGLKESLPEYKKIESRLEKIIFKKYGITPHQSIHIADKRIVLDEVREIMPFNLEIYKKHIKNEELNSTIYYNLPKHVVKRIFLNLCNYFNIKEDLCITYYNRR